jgi:hypothetical protein
MNSEKNLAAPGIQALFFAKFLPSSGFGKLHSWYFSSGFRPERKELRGRGEGPCQNGYKYRAKREKMQPICRFILHHDFSGLYK